MERDALVFSIRYSAVLNQMQATLLNRVDRIINMLLLVFGSAVAADMGSNFVFGLAVALLSAFSFVWQPGKSATFYDIQAKGYTALFTQQSAASTEEIACKYQQLQLSDQPEIGSLRDAAFKRSAISLQRHDDTELTRWQSVIAWLAGDLPR